MENIEKYDVPALEFVFQESSKFLEETLKSFRESINKSFIVLAVYSGFMPYCFEKIANGNFELTTIIYVVIFLGSLVSLIIILPNLLPSQMNFQGTEPDKLINEYFEQEIFKEQQRKQMLRVKIQDHQTAIFENKQNISIRVRRFKISIFVFITFLVISLYFGLGIWFFIRKSFQP